MVNPLLDDLQQSLAGAGRLVEALGPDQWDAPTPCPGWAVRDVVTHLVAGNALFASALAQAEPAPPDPADAGATGYPRSADQLLAAASAPGALEQLVSVPFGVVPAPVAVQMRVVESLVHGWDLARATDQRTAFDDDLVARTDAFTRQLLHQVPADRSPFGPPLPAPAGAPPLDRLAALLGRAA